MTERLITMVPDEAVGTDQVDIVLTPPTEGVKTDDILLSQAKPNPALLRNHQTESTHDRPHLSPGDWEVLRRYSAGFKEPPMGVHNPSECPHCRDNGTK